MKADTPEAFTKESPCSPDAVFIDGQIKLMCPNIDGTLTWDMYIERQFEKHVHKYFTRGIKTVILAFDDYAQVVPLPHLAMCSCALQADYTL